MMTMRSRRLLATAVAAAIAFLAAPAVAAPRVGILVPYFDGPGNIGQNASTAIYFQIWRTLRRAPYPNPANLDFGRGIARYQTEPLRPPSVRSAMQAARYAEVQLVLWGDAKELGDDVLVQAYLASPRPDASDPTHEEWVVHDSRHAVRLGLPRRTFDFDPVVLSKALVARYSSPDAMKMCQHRKLPCDELALTNDWVALDHTNDWARVRNKDGVAGWVYLADIDKMPNSIAQFSSALLAYYRGDFAQAGALFSRVASTPSAKSTIIHDATILAAVAAIRGGVPSRARLERLAADDPFSLYIFQALCMARLQEGLAKPFAQRRADIAQVRRVVDLNRELFPNDSLWLRDFDNFAQSYN